MGQWRLFYDSDCEFCTRSMRRAVRWAERAGQPMESLPLDGPAALARGYGADLVLEADQVYKGGDAWLALFSLAPWYLRWRFAGVRRLFGAAYRLVARNRSCGLGSQSRRPDPRL
jgi:predicted DCC family thiol-disulfide oxidoreductase YuxK